METNQIEKRRKPRTVVSAKIDQASPAFRIVQHLGGLTICAETIDRSVHTVYGWLLRGRIPAKQQANVRDKAAAAGKSFDAEWFLEPVTAKAA